jgi:hypothetical protein
MLPPCSSSSSSSNVVQTALFPQLLLPLATVVLSHHCRLLLLLLLLSLACPLLWQTSCSWVLKESRAVYKAASEGVMNLADKFFEMERAQAVRVRDAAGNDAALLAMNESALMTPP